MSSEHYKKNKCVVKASKEDQEIVIDPYLVAKYSDVMSLGAPAFHMMKKLMRGKSKGHSEEDIVKELFDCLFRWEELIDSPYEDEIPCTEKEEYKKELGTPVADLVNRITDGM